MTALNEKFGGEVSSAQLGGYDYYWGRTLGELPHYFENVGDNPLRPLGSLSHVADGILRTTSDFARVFQDPETRRTIKPLGERYRFVDSAIGTVQDSVGAAVDLLKVKPVSAVGKGVGAFLSLGDIAIGAGADFGDLITGADIKHQRLSGMNNSVYEQLRSINNN
ncbi:hypothetical protein KKF55_04785 [Patescibacteria group bacterium]|nr:hypothetical protein [Patescibacteria group bacterium]